MKTPFNKVCRIGTAKTWGGRYYSVYVKIEWNGKRLSISGVEGPLPSGNCFGGCGQIVMSKWGIENYAKGWNRRAEANLRAIWNRWHLNDMKSACSHQRALGMTRATNPGE